MKVAYARVSTLNQNFDRQIEVFKKKIFTEKLSGKNISERIIFQEAMEFIREGNQFIVEAINRLGRNYYKIIQTLIF